MYRNFVSQQAMKRVGDGDADLGVGLDGLHQAGVAAAQDLGGDRDRVPWRRGRGSRIVGPERGDRGLLGSEPVDGVVDLERLGEAGRRRVLRVRRRRPRRALRSRRQGEAAVATPERLQRRLEGDRRRYPQARPGRRDVLRREVPEISLVPAVTRRPLEDPSGDVTTVLDRPAERRPWDSIPTGQRLLQRVDGGLVGGAGGGEQGAQDRGEGGIDGERPVDVSGPAGEPAQSREHAGDRAVALGSGYGRLVRSQAGVAERPRCDRRAEARRRADECGRQIEPRRRHLGVEVLGPRPAAGRGRPGEGRRGRGASDDRPGGREDLPSGQAGRSGRWRLGWCHGSSLRWWSGRPRSAVEVWASSSEPSADRIESDVEHVDVRLEEAQHASPLGFEGRRRPLGQRTRPAGS